MSEPTAIPKVRLFVEGELSGGGTLALDDNQSHYLVNVMRLKGGAAIALFNGRDGEWLAEMTKARKRSAELTLIHELRPQPAEVNLWLVFAPIKRARLDYMVQKAVELGVSGICPVYTERTVVSRLNHKRMLANAREAAEQCGRLSVPEIREPVDLGQLIADWPAGRRLIFCDEMGEDASMYNRLAGLSGDERSKPWAILIGPEGGFSEQEARKLREQEFVTPVSLGPQVLRADTAAVAALALWQSLLGQWL